MAIITLESLGKRAGGKWVLWDVSLEFVPGEITGVLGQSGAGKSALARVLAGLDAPGKGDILFGDEIEAPAGMISLAMSSPAAARELTVYENLEMFASLWGVSRRKRAREISFLLELMGLADSRGSRVDCLSTGEMERMEIVRALVTDAPVLVIDGLMDRLDRRVMEKLWDYLLKLRREQNKCIVVFTSRGRIAEMCSRIAVMHRGRVVFIGRPDDFRRAAGEDMVVIGDIANPVVRGRVEEKLSVVVKEEDGFLSFKVSNGERAVTDLLADFGSELSCVYLKRPTLEDALDVIAGGGNAYCADTSRGAAQ